MAFKLPKTESGVPLLGIGSGTAYYKQSADAPPNPQLIKIFETAVKEGFTHLDSAECYGNDAELKAALENVTKQGVSRDEIFITDKYYSGDASHSIHSKYANPYDRIKKLTEELGTPYIDLYLLHSPFVSKEVNGFDLKEAWKYVQQALDDGLVKMIGVSNFRVEDIEEIWNTTKTNPQVNQIEFNAFLQNQTPGIVQFCQSHGILVEAYSPLAPLTTADLTKGAGLEFDQFLTELSKKYSKTKTQLLLRWVIQQNIVPITTTSKVERFEEYKGIFEFELAESDVEKIKELGNAYKPVIRKYWIPEFGHYDAEL
ncbi:hypothetical protein CANINC_003129 [Pichia inconspicua]|uniref:2-dehydropantolactone reductase n=1 Tax=Pichia inconspicua TaxID=52247 RepID=A0A4T0WZP8_9ASCO|nr:hypothetical protein CANINC_003129 [[Candida] inconspicua]